MRFTLAVFCLLACGTSALAQQYGVSNARDAYGNLVRNKGVNQTPPDNVSRPINTAPAAPSQSNQPGSKNTSGK